MCKIFSWKISCLTVPKNAVGELCSHSLVSGIEKVWIRVGGGGGMEYHKILYRKLFVSQCRNFL